MIGLHSDSLVDVPGFESSCLGTLEITVNAKKSQMTTPDTDEDAVFAARKERLRTFLEGTGLAMIAVDARIGRKRGYTTNLITRIDRPSAKTFVMYCDAFGISTRWLLDGIGKPTDHEDRPAALQTVLPDQTAAKLAQVEASKGDLPPAIPAPLPSGDLREVAIEALRGSVPDSILRAIRAWPPVDQAATVADWIEVADWLIRMGRRVSGGTVDPADIESFDQGNPVLTRELAAVRRRARRPGA